MKISGFSFVRNGVKLYYPVAESIKSILPIVDEFVVAIGKGDDEDTTREEILKIDDEKIKIIDTEWEEQYLTDGIIYAFQTDIAKNACSGDWLFYLQSDEVIHEKYLQTIKNRCEELLKNSEVEALVFKYKHFWGDYGHYHGGHGWYPREIRIIRNEPDIHSWQDAQSFRKFDNYTSPRQKDGHRKLNAAMVDAEVYHYGWVRPPGMMQVKRKQMDSYYWGKKKAEEHYKNASTEFDYGPLNFLADFEDSDPEVMKSFIEEFNWGEKLQYDGKPDKYREKHNHEKLLYKFLSFIEKHLYGGNQIGEFKNYELIDV